LEIDEKYNRKIEDLETTLRTQASQLAQLSELNSRMSGEIRELKKEQVRAATLISPEAQEDLKGLLRDPEFLNRLAGLVSLHLKGDVKERE